MLRRGKTLTYYYACMAVTVAASFFAIPTKAEILKSPNFTVNSNASSNFGGQTGSTSYKMTTTGGEAVVGSGSSTSYKIASGYQARLDQAIQLNVQPSGQLIYTPLNEPTGTVAYDSSINNTNGTYTNSPTVVTGKIGSARQFNGSNQSVVFNGTASTAPTKLTASAYINTSTTSGAMPIILKPNAWGLFVVAGKLASYDWSTGSTRDTGITVANGAWRHVAITIDNGVTNGTKIYLDGNEVFTTTITASSQATPVYLANNSASQYYNGSIDEAKLYSRILSAAEIKAESDAGNAGILSGLAFDSISPGVSQSVGADVNVLTDSGGYNLAFAQNNNLTNGGNNIPAISSGSIASPAAWSEGSTKGLGFTLSSAPGLPAKWNSGASYAPIPGSSTTFYTRSGYSGGVKDVVNMQYRVDVPISQATGSYQNTVTYTATTIP